ncbi:MAG: adaptor protein MecA [Catonella sp.]|nr:adaptor protein MecA [Catonella sp.]MDY6355943.1 adaptor protein MecA [Catonella sp.]
MRIEKISEKEIKCTFSKTDLKKRSLSAEDVIKNTEKSDILSSEAVSAADRKFHIAKNGISLSTKPHANSNGSLSYIIKLHNEKLLSGSKGLFEPVTKSVKPDVDAGIFMNLDDFNGPANGSLVDINIPSDNHDISFEDIWDDMDTDFPNYEGTFDFGDGNSLSFAITAVPISDEMMTNALYMLASDDEDNDVFGPEHSFLPLPDFLRGDDEKTADRHFDCRIYRFSSFSEVSRIAGSLAGVYHGSSSLYRDKKGDFLLILDFSGVKKEEIGEALAVLSEFTSSISANYASISYIKEHMEKIVENNALQIINVT